MGTKTPPLLPPKPPASIPTLPPPTSSCRQEACWLCSHFRTYPGLAWLRWVPQVPYLGSKLQVFLWAIGDTPQGGKIVVTDDSCLWTKEEEGLAPDIKYYSSVQGLQLQPPDTGGMSREAVQPLRGPAPIFRSGWLRPVIQGSAQMLPLQRPSI